MRVLLSLILALSLSFCQSQTIQKINNKEVIVMSVEDGNKINQVFTDKQKQIDSLKLHLDSVKYYHNQYMIFNGQRLQRVYNSYNQELNNYRLAKLESDSFRTLYLANRKIYEHREREFRKERINQQFFTLGVMILTVILAIK